MSDPPRAPLASLQNAAKVQPSMTAAQQSTPGISRSVVWLTTGGEDRQLPTPGATPLKGARRVPVNAPASGGKPAGSSTSAEPVVIVSTRQPPTFATLISSFDGPLPEGAVELWVAVSNQKRKVVLGGHRSMLLAASFLRLVELAELHYGGDEFLDTIEWTTSDNRYWITYEDLLKTLDAMGNGRENRQRYAQLRGFIEAVLAKMKPTKPREPNNDLERFCEYIGQHYQVTAHSDGAFTLADAIRIFADYDESVMYLSFNQTDGRVDATKLFRLFNSKDVKQYLRITKLKLDNTEDFMETIDGTDYVHVDKIIALANLCSKSLPKQLYRFAEDVAIGPFDHKEPMGEIAGMSYILLREGVLGEKSILFKWLDDAQRKRERMAEEMDGMPDEHQRKLEGVEAVVARHYQLAGYQPGRVIHVLFSKEGAKKIGYCYLHNEPFVSVTKLLEVFDVAAESVKGFNFGGDSKSYKTIDSSVNSHGIPAERVGKDTFVPVHQIVTIAKRLAGDRMRECAGARWFMNFAADICIGDSKSCEPESELSASIYGLFLDGLLEKGTPIYDLLCEADRCRKRGNRTGRADTDVGGKSSPHKRKFDEILSGDWLQQIYNERVEAVWGSDIRNYVDEHHKRYVANAVKAIAEDQAMKIAMKIRKEELFHL